ncbi:MAG TPA: MoxR family ATPase [Egibacteraceae bacterium]|nr:MoxR family ATPase [Actinomycetota bacterium]HWB72529.1 MoxR family ATPase [Egibacteraceae bacterium]
MAGTAEAAVAFGSIDEVDSALRRRGYLADEATATIVFLAARLAKPLLVEGPAGTGKTDLARALAQATGRRLVRLQCYEGLDETKVLYEWNYRKQLLGLQAARDTAGTPGAELEDVFSEPFLLSRPVLDAIRSPAPVVLLIDELDRIEMETEALLLEVLSDFQITIPELGLVQATTRPLTVLTSNATRELSEALKRRCLYLWLDYPSLERERAIVMARVPGIAERLATQVVRTVQQIRSLDLKKPPSVAETLDWAATLVQLGLDSADREALRRTMGALLKHRSDLAQVERQLEADTRG